MLYPHPVEEIMALTTKKTSEINKCSIVMVVVVICWSWENMSRVICRWRLHCLRKDGPLNHQGLSSLVFLLLLPHTSSHCWINDYLHIWKSIEMWAWNHSLWNGTVCDKGLADQLCTILMHCHMSLKFPGHSNSLFLFINLFL